MYKYTNAAAVCFGLLLFLTSCSPRGDGGSAPSAPGEPVPPAAASMPDTEAAAGYDLPEGPDYAAEGLRLYRVEELEYRVLQVKSEMRALELDLDRYGGVAHAGEDRLYLYRRSGPYSAELTAYSIPEGQELGTVEERGSFRFGGGRVLLSEAEYGENGPPSTTVSEYDADLKLVRRHVLEEPLEYSGAVTCQSGVILYGREALYGLDPETGDKKELDSSFLGGDAVIMALQATDMEDMVVVTVVPPQNSGAVYTESRVLYDIKSQKAVGETIRTLTNGEGGELNKYYQFDDTCGFIYLPENYVINGFTFTNGLRAKGVFMGRGTYSSNSVSEVALFDPSNGLMRTSIPPGYPDIYPVTALSPHEMLVEFRQDGKVCLGILAFTAGREEAGPDTLDLSGEYLSSLAGSSLPVVDDCRNWGEGQRAPTTLGLLSDILYPYARAYGYTLFDDPDLGGEDLATVCALELAGMGRFPGKPPDRFAVPEEDGYSSYMIPAEEMDEMVRALFPAMSGASRRTGMIRAPGYSEESGGYGFTLWARPFSGNYDANSHYIMVQLVSGRYDEAGGRLRLEAELWAESTEGQVRLGMEAAVKVDTATGAFSYESVKVSGAREEGGP